MNECGELKYRVMLVEDSSTVRSFLTNTLSGDENIEVVAQAENGQVALDIVQNANPDVIILDVEMPVMDGITALPQLLKLSPKSKIIMVSTLTQKHAAMSIKALASGASDYLEKPTAETDKEAFKKELIEKVKILAGSKRKFADSEFPSLKLKAAPSFPEREEIIEIKHEIKEKPEEIVQPVKEIIKEPAIAPKIIMSSRPQALAIGCSTGGPQALTKLFKDLDSQIKDIPIFITQHMPANFTTFLASSIDRLGEMQCFEAADGMKVEAGKAYLAPGDFHMTIENNGIHKTIRLNQDAPENFCRPAVDPMLRSLVDVYGANILLVIMTGMGQDGLEGAKKVSEKGGKIIIQDEASSVVWGMPGAIAKASLQDGFFALDDLAPQIIKLCTEVL